MAVRWTNDDEELFKNHLVDGIPVQYMMALFPSRSEGAIRLKAQVFEFGVITSREDGITRFYENIKSRVRGANALSETDEVSSIINATEVAHPPQAVLSNGVDHSEPETHIIQYDGLSANVLAVRMLTENDLSVDPDIVHALSLHILKEQ